MPNNVSRRLGTLMRQLNFPRPEQVFALYEDNSRLVAEEVLKALDRVLKEVQKASRGNALDGYEAVMEKAENVPAIKLPRSGFTLPEISEWLIYVRPSKHHENMDLSVFEVIDQGRPAITKPGVYPLWGARYLANVQIGRYSPTRPEPREKGQKGDVPIVTVGGKNLPSIAQVQGKLLYDAALRRAKDRLTIKGLDRQWDVIKVGFE